MENLKIFDISNWFLSKSSMSHKKLQKLTYYAQAWSLALLNEPLFEEHFEAWVHGPVNVELYNKYNEYGWKNIPQQDYTGAKLSEEIINVLESVYFTYGEFSANQLEWKTHQELPWLEARKGLGDWDKSNNIISNETMKQYYKSVYVGD